MDNPQTENPQPENGAAENPSPGAQPHPDNWARPETPQPEAPNPIGAQPEPPEATTPPTPEERESRDVQPSAEPVGADTPVGPDTDLGVSPDAGSPEPAAPARPPYILLRHRDLPDLDNLDVYRQHGGFQALEKVVTQMQPLEVVNAVKASGLRGRGGAGFPTGMKWSFIDNNNWPHYVVANADESEPGTFKDREIMEGNPFQFLEGVAICAYAVQAHAAYLYLRGEFWELAARLDQQIAAMEAAGLLGDRLFGADFSLRIYTHLGAGAYICGEETAMLESLEGKLGQPRLRPPFPPSFGLYGKPTIVNNVETLANVPLILQNGADWYRSFGTEKSPGVKIFSLSGCINRPGNYELPLGTTFRQLLFDHGGGIPEGRKVKAIMAAGASSSLIVATDEALDTPMDYENVPKVGAQLGSASVIVIDDSVPIPWLINKTVHFFRHESCGKCTPCREGTFWMSHLTERIVDGQASTADVELLHDVASQMRGKCLCALGEFSIEAVLSGLDRFRPDFDIAVEAIGVASEGPAIPVGD